jgi:hypothetical protein
MNLSSRSGKLGLTGRGKRARLGRSNRRVLCFTWNASTRAIGDCSTWNAARAGIRTSAPAFAESKNSTVAPGQRDRRKPGERQSGRGVKIRKVCRGGQKGNPAMRGDQPHAGLGGMRHPIDGAKNYAIKARIQRLRAPCIHSRGNSKPPDRFPQKGSLLVLRLRQRNFNLRPAKRNRNSRQSGAGAKIQQGRNPGW